MQLRVSAVVEGPSPRNDHGLGMTSAQQPHAFLLGTRALLQPEHLGLGDDAVPDRRRVRATGSLA